jgi:hypothetical protein
LLEQIEKAKAALAKKHFFQSVGVFGDGAILATSSDCMGEQPRRKCVKRGREEERLVLWGEQIFDPFRLPYPDHSSQPNF